MREITIEMSQRAIRAPPFVVPKQRNSYHYLRIIAKTLPSVVCQTRQIRKGLSRERFEGIITKLSFFSSVGDHTIANEANDFGRAQILCETHSGGERGPCAICGGGGISHGKFFL